MTQRYYVSLLTMGKLRDNLLRKTLARFIQSLVFKHFNTSLTVCRLRHHPHRRSTTL